MATKDEARVSTFVEVDPRDAFEVFTDEIDVWWRREPRFRAATTQQGLLRFEGGEKRRLVEILDRGKGEVIEIGRVLVWEPSRRLVFEWRNIGYARDETTEVEVSFEPREGGTEVTIAHRGWAAIADKRAAAKGLDADAFLTMVAYWWGDVATAFRAFTTTKKR